MIDPEPTPPPESARPVSGSAESDDPVSRLDLRALQQTVDRHLKPNLFGESRPTTPPAAPVPNQTEEHLQELVEDMLDLLRRVKGIEAAQAETASRLDRLEQSLREGLFLQARETDTVRRELIGEQRAFTALATAEAILPVLDKLRPMRAGLNPRKQEALVNQLNAILEVLTSMLRTLGFVSFEPAVGDAFDPRRMRCVGHKKGPAGVVLGVEQPGYLVSQTQAVVRSAGVLLAPTPPVR